MSKIILLRKYNVEDFLSIDHGTEAVTITSFKGDTPHGTPGWAHEIRLTPEAADELAAELTRRTREIREAKE